MAGTSLGYSTSSVGNGLLFDDDADSTVFKNFTDGPSTLLVAHALSAANAITYLSIWNKRTPTGGSDGQDYQFPIPATTGNKVIVFERGAVLTAGGSYMVTTGKGTAASGNPNTPIDVWFLTSATDLRAAPGVLSITPADPTAAGPSSSSSITQALAGPPTVDPSIDSSTRLLSASAATVYSIEIDNRQSTADAFFKAWNVASTGDVTLGTTAPEIIVRAMANEVTRVVCLSGFAMGTGIVYACVTDNGTGGTTSPTVKPKLEMMWA